MQDQPLRLRDAIEVHLKNQQPNSSLSRDLTPLPQPKANEAFSHHWGFADKSLQLLG
jgi:hypothetical protein